MRAFDHLPSCSCCKEPNDRDDGITECASCEDAKRHLNRVEVISKE
jgi:recombinational DNA repair protein RecR